MKTTRILNQFSFLFASALLVVSCQKSDALRDENPARVFATVENASSAAALPDYDTYCISPDGPFVELSGSKTVYWGNSSNPKWKTVSYVSYNTASEFVVEVTYTQSQGNASNTVSVTANGSTQSVPSLASGSTATFSFPLPAGWSKGDAEAFSVYQEGQNSPLTMSDTYYLYELCCETLFSGQAIACGNQREAVYTFKTEDAVGYFKIQGGLTNFTGADAVVEVTGGSNITVSQSTPGNSTNRVIKVEGSAGSCDEIIIRITWNSTNSGGIITGSWSVKDANGNDIAPEVAGLSCGG
jgi:hypothetical protein